MAYNEEANLGKLLDALLNQNLNSGTLEKIVVIASGCTDRTEEIAQEYAQKYPCIALYTQPKREGKASAINLWLSKISPDIDICLMESADTIPAQDAVEQMIQPFTKPVIGMTGAHPTPTNPQHTFMGFMAHLVWGLHHQIAMQYPKLGEMVAFRNVVKSIPYKTPVDEVSIEAVIKSLGLELQYVPQAIVYNSGPKNVYDFIKQRRRIYAGHLFVRNDLHYAPATMQGNLVFNHLLNLMEFSGKKILWTIGAIGLEVWSRILGNYDFHIKKQLPYKWDIAESTKELKNFEKNPPPDTAL